jgi:hypothetical protein
LQRGIQADHIRGVTRMALAVAEQLQAQLPDRVVDRDIVMAGALCHGIGKPLEFDPENRRRWEADPRAAGLPSIRHPAFGVHVCPTVGLPEEVALRCRPFGRGQVPGTRGREHHHPHADSAFWGICRPCARSTRCISPSPIRQGSGSW